MTEHGHGAAGAPRILVTGGTGFIGMEVVRALAARGLRPRVLVRRESRARLLHHLDIEAVHGDLLSRPSLERAVAGIDAIVHLGGRATFESYDQLAPTLIGGTIDLAEVAAEAGVQHIVFGSSLFVHDGSEAVDDRTAPAPELDYGRVKLEAEAALSAIAAEGGPSVAAIRLPHVYGPQSVLFGLVRRRFVVFPGSGENRFAQLHVDDAARLLVEAARQQWSGTCPVADDLTVTWNEFFEVLHTHAPAVRVLRVPATLAIGAARLAGPIIGRAGPTLLSADTIRGWNLDLPVVSRTLWNELGLTPMHPTVYDGIPATLDATVAFRWRHPVFDWS